MIRTIAAAIALCTLCVDAAEAQTQTRYYARGTLSGKAAPTTPPAPATRSSCGSFQNARWTQNESGLTVLGKNVYNPTDAMSLCSAYVADRTVTGLCGFETGSHYVYFFPNSKAPYNVGFTTSANAALCQPN